MNEQSLIRELKGIGEKTEKLFQKLGVYTIGDILLYYPKDYKIFEQPVSISSLKTGKIISVRGSICNSPQVRKTQYLQILNVQIKDGMEKLDLTWFNMPYLKSTLKMGQTYIFHGKVSSKKGRFVLEQPQIYTMEQYMVVMKSLQPIYGLTKGLTNTLITKTIRQILDQSFFMEEYLPDTILQRHKLLPYHQSICTLHFPVEKDTFKLARKRLVFDEFLLFILCLGQLKESGEELDNNFHLWESSESDALAKKLPYDLTKAQKRVWEELKRDFQKDCVMQRLIQGDVGSGKTILAILALVKVAENGYQGALMVPTEVLAKQHLESILSLFEEQDISYGVALLTGSMTAKEKKEVYRQIAANEVAIVIGTHALIQEKVKYHNLALVITDEQHRFGVKQRELFFQKGNHPHTIVMSATPIPRTLAIILYGDLDISVIDELPANRLPIKNCVVAESYRPTAYRFIKDQIALGRQAYVICPLVEESEMLDAENVMDYTKKIKEHLPEQIQVAFLHGKMKAKEKNERMEQYLKREIHVLVSTTVIEVGVNVPNATVMLIENAERFGVAQLHQLRGRVGRGKHQSYCIMVNSSENEENKKRLAILNQSNDGFFIANEDLKLRGPGDLFGCRQSGLLNFRIGDIFADANLLQLASEEAQRILIEDKELITPQYKGLKYRLDVYKKQQFDILRL